MKKLILLFLFLSFSAFSETAWFRLQVETLCCPETTNLNEHQEFVPQQTQVCAPAFMRVGTGTNGSYYDLKYVRDPDESKYAFCNRFIDLEGATNLPYINQDEFGNPTNMTLLNPSNHFIIVELGYPDICSLHRSDWTCAVIHYWGRWKDNPSSHWQIDQSVTIPAGFSGGTFVFHITNTAPQNVACTNLIDIAGGPGHVDFPPPNAHVSPSANGTAIWTINNLPNTSFKVFYSTNLNNITANEWDLITDQTGFIQYEIGDTNFINSPYWFFSGYGTTRE